MTGQGVCLQVVQLRCSIQTPTGWLRAVDSVSFTVHKGETLALLGESGCGKSMTALAINRLLPKSAYLGEESQILWYGQDLLNLSQKEMRAIRGTKIAMIFQEPMTALNPVMTVQHQLEEVLSQRQFPSKQDKRARCIELLEQVKIPYPDIRLSQYPHELSGGMMQRVMIAMALAGEPDLLIADEPTTALDVTVQREILQLLRSLQEETGMGLLLITHDLGVVTEIADRVAVMYAGELVETATLSQFFAKPEHPYSQAMLQTLPSLAKRQYKLQSISGQVPILEDALTLCRFKPRCARKEVLCDSLKPEWLSLTSNHQARCHFAATERKASRVSESSAFFIDKSLTEEKATTPILSVLNLAVAWKKTGLKAVNGVSFEIQSGQTLALVGESGCGKTTVSKAILHLLPKQDCRVSGTVLLQGVPLQLLGREALRMQRRDMQIIFQDPFTSLNPRMLVRDILAEPLLTQKMLTEKETLDYAVDSLLDKVGLSSTHKLRYPHEFSGGQRQRLAIARSLAVKPKLLICDEPTSALDVSVQAQLLNLFRDLQQQYGMAYLFITHDMSVVAYMAHEVAVMHAGTVVEHGDSETVLLTPSHHYTQTLLKAVPKIELLQKRDACSSVV